MLNHLTIKFKKRLFGDWCGNWNIEHRWIHLLSDLRKLPKEYQLLVATHEFIELVASQLLNVPDCCSSAYDNEKHGYMNSQAHYFAEEVEKLILTRFTKLSWEEYSKVIEGVRIKVYGNDKGSIPCNYCDKLFCKAKEKSLVGEK